MHERFCFFSPAQWAELLAERGFAVDVTPIRNEWLIANRFAPAARVFREENGELVEDEWGWTNVLLVATTTSNA